MSGSGAAAARAKYTSFIQHHQNRSIRRPVKVMSFIAATHSTNLSLESAVVG